MDAQQQAQRSLMNRGNKKRLRRRLIIVAIVTLVLVASTITIFSLVGVIPGIWATIISAVLTIFSPGFGVLTLVPADDKPAVAAPPVISPSPSVPFTEPAQPTPSPTPDKSTSAFRGIVGIPPPSDRCILHAKSLDLFGFPMYNPSRLERPG